MNPEDNTLSNQIAEELAQDLQFSLGISRIDAITYVRKRGDIVAALVKAQVPSAQLAPATAGEERQLITRRDLPEEAPGLWARDKQPGDTPPDFIKRHYGPWIGKGLSRPDIDRCDHTLYVALGRWLEKPSNSLPFDLPSKRELMEREASHLLPEEVRETQRQLSRQHRRLKHISRDRS